MKRALSQTIALAYSTGLSLCLASSNPLDEQLQTPRKPRTQQQDFNVNFVDPFPEIKPKVKSSSSPQTPLVLRSNSPNLRRDSSEGSSRLYWVQDTLLVEHQTAGYLNQVQGTKHKYDEGRKSLEKEQATLEQDFKQKNDTLKSYQGYLEEHNILPHTTSFTDGADGQELLMAHISYLKGQLEQLQNSSPSNTEDIEKLKTTIALLGNKPDFLQQEIYQINASLRDIDQKLNKLHIDPITEAVKNYQDALQSKLTTSIRLRKLGYPQDTLITVGDARLTFIEMGVPSTLLNDRGFERSKTLLGAILKNALWPSFSMSESTSTEGERKLLSTSGIPETRDAFLKELNHRTTFAINEVQKNYQRHAQNMATQLKLMKEYNVPVKIKDLFPNVLYDGLIIKTEHEKLTNQPSRLLEIFFTDPEEGLFGGITLNEDPQTDNELKEESLAMLREDIPLTSATALMQLTYGIQSIPPLSTQLSSSQSLPSEEAIRNLVLIKKGQTPDHAKVNEGLARTLGAMSFYRANGLFLQPIRTNLTALFFSENDE